MGFLWELWTEHKGKIIGGVLGLFVSIIILTLGFVKAIFVILCTLLGYYIGKCVDNNIDFRKILDKILPPSR